MKTKRMEKMSQLALDNGLDPFPVVYETVEKSTMTNVVSYGLPTRARHWSYGRSYEYQKTYGEMGYSKIYEVILNNNPSYAFMLDTNNEVQNLFITAHCAGHCFFPQTLIETIDGPKQIKDITTEDKILTHTGKYRHPMAISRRNYSGELIKIKIGSQEVICTPEHPFYVVKQKECSLLYRQSVCKNNCKYKNQKQCDNKPYQSYSKEWVKAKDLKPKDFVIYPKSKILGLEKVDSFKISGKKGEGHPGGIIDVNYNISIDGKFGEFLGLFLAEGYSRPKGQMGLCFHTKEKSFHNKSKQLIKDLFSLNVYDDIKEDTHSHQILFNEIVLSNWLRNNCGAGCQNKQIPDFLFKSANEDFLKSFLRGVFHGDGCNGERNLDLTTTSSKLATQVRQICLSFNIKTNIKIKKRDGKKDSYVINISGTSKDRFGSLTSIEWDINDGDRSYEFCWFDDDNVYIPISEVRVSCGSSYVFNLEVPEDSSYVLFAGAVTHNSDFFKNNCMFQGTDRNMIGHAAEHAARIESYIERFGFERVERLMDIGFALDDHIDCHKGLYRKPYEGKKQNTRYQEMGEFDDVVYRKQNRQMVIKEVVNANFPPHPEKDILWFLINYAPLEEWEKDVLDIIREEAYYFYPQKMTKIMNEGWASYWHAELMYQFDLSSSEFMDFARDHERVVQPGANPFKINPYFLGYRIFKDIKERWDKKYGEGAGLKKIFEVRKEEEDISFVRNYLTSELVKDLNLFTFGYAEDYQKDHNGEKLIEIKECMRDNVIETLVQPLYNGGAPKIVISEIGAEGTLILKHISEDTGTIDQNFAKKTIEYIWDLWAAPVELYAKDDDGSDIAVCFDEAGAYIKNLDEIDDDEEEVVVKEHGGGLIIMP